MASILFFFLLQLLLLLSSANAATHWQDRQFLLQLKAAVLPSSIPPASCLDTWHFSLDPCDSLFSPNFTCGFRCSSSADSPARLIDLSLDSAAYSANLSSLPWHFLPSLQTLDFNHNNFFGSIPDSLSSLSNLSYLSFSHNSLSGPIPESLSSLLNLQELILDGNYLSGEIPSALNALTNLRRLELQSNNFTARFPDLRNLSALGYLDASENSISGDLPAAFPPSITELALRNNQITGCITPETLASSPYLQVLDLSHNRLSGEIPPALFSHPSLEQVTLAYNQFGSVPEPANDPGLAGSQLVSLDLSNNQIRGFLPGFMGRIPRLSALSLENNKFSGPIPTQYVLKTMDPGAGSVSGSSQLERLLLGGNYLYGPIPGAFLGLKAGGTVMVRLGDNCLYRCPMRWFFCGGGVQKPLMVCKAFGPIIP